MKRRKNFDIHVITNYKRTDHLENERIKEPILFLLTCHVYKWVTKNSVMEMKDAYTRSFHVAFFTHPFIQHFFLLYNENKLK